MERPWDWKLERRAGKFRNGGGKFLLAASMLAVLASLRPSNTWYDWPPNYNMIIFVIRLLIERGLIIHMNN